MEWLAGLIQHAVSDAGTESLAHLLQRVAEQRGVWNGILQQRPGAPPLVLMQSPTMPLADLPDPRHWSNPSGLSDSPVVWRVEPLPIPDTFYALRIPREAAHDPLWDVLVQLIRLLCRQEQLHREIDNLRRQSERRLLTVATLYETAFASSHYELERFLQLVTERAAHAMDAQACTLMLLEPDQNTLRIAASYGLPPELTQQVRVPLGEGIAGRVALTGEPMIITDPTQHPQLTDIVPRPEISSSICVPLHNRTGGLLGVLTLRRLQPAPSFTSEDLNAFTIFANQIALAIENARLYANLNRRVQELTTLVNLSQVVSAILDIETLLELVGRQIEGVVGFSRYALFLQSESLRTYQLSLVRGYTREMFPPRGFRKGQGVIGIVAKKKMPLVVQDARRELQPMRGFGRTIGANRYCVLPIIIHGSCIGVILADNEDRSGEFSLEQVDLLSVFTTQVGIAIENARLYREMEQHYREIQSLAAFRNNILRSLGAGVFTLSPNGYIATWNRAAQTITGIRARDVMGKHYSELCKLISGRIREDALRMLQSALDEVIKGGVSRTLYRIPFRKTPDAQDEAQLLNFTITPLVMRGAESSGGAVVVFEDVTEYHRLETRLSQMERLAEIGQMTATIAHEIRNPLTALKGAADLLMQEENLPEQVQTYVDIIRQEVARLNDIAEEFLEFARPFVLNRRPVVLRPLLKRLMQALAPYFKEAKITAQLEIAGEPSAHLDPVRIEQVLRNLIQNAIQAMPNGGRLFLRAGEQNNRVYLQVQDTGEGIPTEIREKIFSPFYTTRTRGTGLGLSIVQKIVQAHQGEVCVECPAEGGSIFTVWLPKMASGE
ncbi:Sporulation kinase E [bacterium HR15]|nr:Sporulation kinase E [bacterium HR15]